MHKRLKRCPVCNIDLVIREYYCPDCEITIRGDFTQSDLATLTLGQQEFVKVFLLAQGNIKEVEKRLGISYPTVKNRLGEIVRQLEVTEKKEVGVLEMLDKIEEGEISVEQAISLIRDKQK